MPYTSLVAAVDDVVIHGPGRLGSRANGDVLLLGEFKEIRTPSVRLSTQVCNSISGGITYANRL